MNYRGAGAQYSRYGGRNMGMLGMFMDSARARTNAGMRAAQAQIQRMKNSMQLGRRMFDSGLNFSKARSMADLGLRRDMFNRSMRFQNHAFDQMRPSDLEMFLTVGLPYVQNSALLYKQQQWQKEQADATQNSYREFIDALNRLSTRNTTQRGWTWEKGRPI